MPRKPSYRSVVARLHRERCELKAQNLPEQLKILAHITNAPIEEIRKLIQLNREKLPSPKLPSDDEDLQLHFQF